MSQQTPFPIKIAVFTSGPMSLATILHLHEKQLLAGVVLGTQKKNLTAQAEAGQYDVNLIAYLEQLGVNRLKADFKCESDAVDQLVEWEANVGLVLGFPSFVPAEIREVFRFGIYNVHASLLPKYRGAMPLYWQIRNQELKTAITIHKVEQEIDCGNVVYQQLVPIHPRDTLYSLAGQLAEYMPASADALVELIVLAKGIPNGEAQAGDVSYAAWPSQEDTFINWRDMSAAQIIALAQAGNPSIGALMFVGKTPVSLLQASVIEYETFGTAVGTIIHVGEPEGLIVSVSDGALRLDILSIAEGVFSGVAFAERFELNAGSVFETPRSCLQ